MLTVIFAERETIELFQQYSLFLKPLMQNKSVAFCETDLTADSVEDMLPRLHQIISNCDTWRAMILPSLPKDRLNPYQLVPFIPLPKPDKQRRVDWQALADVLTQREAGYRKALDNPLVKLGCAFGRARAPIEKEAEHAYDAFRAGELPLSKRLLQKRMEGINLNKSVHWFERYGNDEISRIVRARTHKEQVVDADASPEEQDAAYEAAVNDGFAKLLDALRRSDADAILEMIGEENVVVFAEQIAALDALFTDPLYAVYQFDEVSKNRYLETLKDRFELNDIKPTELMCIATRTCDLDDLRLNLEEDLVHFAEANLYPDNMKFMVFDLLPPAHRQYEQDCIRFLTTVLTLALHELPHQCMENGELYQLDSVVNKERLRGVCGAFDAKLAKTRSEIMFQIGESMSAEKDPLDNAEAQELFESDTQVRVEISPEFVRSGLMASFDNIGLAGDCPEDELSAWSAQYKHIAKRFQRYLRQPRRSLKTAVNGDFVQNRILLDERARRLNEFQTEDVVYHLQEEERNLAETPTVDLFRNDSFAERLQKASDSLKRFLGCRMTRNLTLGVGAAAGAAFLFGFLPMLFSDLNTAQTLGISALLALASLAILLGVGLIVLFRFRKQTRAKFFEFNNVVNSIHSEILDGLRAFSVYLSHASNVMRMHSVLNAKEEEFSEEVRIMKKHVVDIDRKREEIRRVAAGNFEMDPQAYYEAEAYDYDFKQLKLYEYDPVFTQAVDNVAFIERGTFVTVPVDYLVSITVRKEASDV